MTQGFSRRDTLKKLAGLAGLAASSHAVALKFGISTETIGQHIFYGVDVVTWYWWKPLPLRQVFEEIRAAGFEGVELVELPHLFDYFHVTPEETFRELKARGCL